MSLKELTKYLNNPLNLKRLSIAKIQELIQSHPSFPALYHLLAEKTADLPEPERREIILNIATHTPNRALLFQQLFGKKGIDREVRSLLRTVNAPKKTHGKKQPKEKDAPIVQKEAAQIKEVKEDVKVEKVKSLKEQKPKGLEEEKVSSFANWLSGMSMETLAPVDPELKTEAIKTVKPIAPEAKERVEKAPKKQVAKNKAKAASTPKTSKAKRSAKKVKKPKKKDKVQNIIDQSVVEGSETISETLAMLLARQGYHDKAIRMYEKLSLNNPQKSALFAEQIEKIRNKKK